MANLDPYQSSNPEDCQQALEAVGLWSLVQKRGGLAESMKAESLSQGQKQLFSISRAILRAKTRAKAGATGGLLLLDEVTSSVDGATDTMIQGIIREVFQDYTIIAVAHRTETLKDFDRIVVMEGGKIRDVGSPKTIQDF
jgi:ATP-binding cassette subfamily C (CFTR/MRP) protein 1